MPSGQANEGANQLLSAFSSVLFDDLFCQSFHILFHRVFHFHILVISSFFERSRLGVKVPVLDEGFHMFHPAAVRGKNRSDLSDLLTRPPPFLPLCAFAKRGGGPCELARSLPKTLRRPERGWLRPTPLSVTEGCLGARGHSTDHTRDRTNATAT